MKALTKSAPFCTEPGSSVSLDDWRRKDETVMLCPTRLVGPALMVISTTPCGHAFSSGSLGPLPLPIQDSSPTSSSTHPQLNTPTLEVKPDLKPKLLNDWGEYLHPVLLEGRVPVRRYRNPSHLRRPTLQRGGGDGTLDSAMHHYNAGARFIPAEHRPSAWV